MPKTRASRSTAAPRSARALAALLARVESMAVRGTERHWGRITPDLARRLRPRFRRVGDGLATMLETSDSLRLNRVIGLGHLGAAKEAMIDEIIAHYRAGRRERFSLEMSPGPQARTLTRWLLRRGFERHGGTTLLLRDCRRLLPEAGSDLRVRTAGPECAETIVRILEACFGRAPSRRPWSLAAASSRETDHLIAWDGTTPVAVGMSRIDGDLVWLGGGATLTPWRRRGAHAALIVERLRRARRRGCRWAWVETAAPAPGRPDISRRNLLRMGFEEACVKPVFLWSER